MGLATDPMVALWNLVAVMLALTGGDWAILIAAVLGAGGVSGIATSMVGLRQQKIAARAQKVTGEATIRTVAAEEAEAAMRIMGDTVKALQERVVSCEGRCDKCEDAWLEHVQICPLWKEQQR